MAQASVTKTVLNPKVEFIGWRYRNLKGLTRLRRAGSVKAAYPYCVDDLGYYKSRRVQNLLVQLK